MLAADCAGSPETCRAARRQQRPQRVACAPAHSGRAASRSEAASHQWRMMGETAPMGPDFDVAVRSLGYESKE